MGRVTFQTPSVNALLKRHVVTTHTDAAPGFSGTPLKKGTTDFAPRFAAWWPSGTADSNVMTLFTTSDGLVLHMLRGFVRPAEFEGELRWVLQLADEVRAAGDSLVRREDVIRRRHEARLAQLRGRFGEPVAVDTTRPPSPDAFQPDRFWHHLIRMHEQVLNDPGDVGLLPTVNGRWDRSRKALATLPVPKAGDGVVVAAAGAGPAPAPVPGASPRAAPRIPTPATPAPVSQAGANVGGVSNGASAGPPPSPTVGQRLAQQRQQQQAQAQAQQGAAGRQRAAAAAQRQQAQSQQRLAAANAAASRARGLGAGVTPGAVMNLAAVAPTSQDFHRAGQAAEADAAANAALAFYASGSACHEGCEVPILRELQRTAPASTFRLFEATRAADAAAGYAALARITGRDLGHDEAAWRRLLERMTPGKRRR